MKMRMSGLMKVRMRMMTMIRKKKKKKKNKKQRNEEKTGGRGLSAISASLR